MVRNRLPKKRSPLSKKKGGGGRYCLRPRRCLQGGEYSQKSKPILLREGLSGEEGEDVVVTDYSALKLRETSKKLNCDGGD